MSQSDRSLDGYQAAGSDFGSIAHRVLPSSLMSVLLRVPHPKLALLAVGVVGVAVLMLAYAVWVPGQNDASRQVAVSSMSDTVEDVPSTSVVEEPEPTPVPRVHVVSAGESLLEIAGNYGVTADLVARANDLWDPNKLQIGQKLVIPDPVYSTRAPRSEESGQMRMWWPIMGEITTEFGEREAYYIGGAHTGIDIAANYGAPVRAAVAGKVVVAWKRPDNIGWHIVVDHGNGWSTLYGHLSKFLVDQGDSVERGQVIGAVGDTGFSFGPHLHFEVRDAGVPVDPMKYLP